MTQLEQIQQAAREFRVARQAFHDAPMWDIVKCATELGVAWDRVLKAIEAAK